MSGRRRPEEPLPVAAAFAADPLRAAREVLLDEVKAGAGAGPESQCIRSWARASWGLEALANATRDDKVSQEACTESLDLMAKAGLAPGLSLADMSMKLALLIRTLNVDAIGGLDGTGGAQLALAAGALADVVMLAAGPIHLPRDACEPIADAVDVARLRARAGRAA